MVHRELQARDYLERHRAGAFVLRTGRESTNIYLFPWGFKFVIPNTYTYAIVYPRTLFYVLRHPHACWRYHHYPHKPASAVSPGFMLEDGCCWMATQLTEHQNESCKADVCQGMLSLQIAKDTLNP